MGTRCRRTPVTVCKRGVTGRASRRRPGLCCRTGPTGRTSGIDGILALRRGIMACRSGGYLEAPDPGGALIITTEGRNSG